MDYVRAGQILESPSVLAAEIKRLEAEVTALRAENAGLRKVYEASVLLRRRRGARGPDDSPMTARQIVAYVEADALWETALDEFAASQEQVSSTPIR